MTAKTPMRPNHDDDLINQAKMFEAAPDTVVSLSEYGRAVYNHLLSECSAIAGRPISMDDIIEVRDAMRAEYATDDLDFTNPHVMERFRELLRAL